LDYYLLEYIINIRMKKTIYSKEHKYTVEQLKKGRKEAGLTQVEVARIIHRTQSYISKIESGQRRIDLYQLIQLANVYKKEITFFIKNPSPI